MHVDAQILRVNQPKGFLEISYCRHSPSSSPGSVTPNHPALNDTPPPSRYSSTPANRRILDHCRSFTIQRHVIAEPNSSQCISAHPRGIHHHAFGGIHLNQHPTPEKNHAPGHGILGIQDLIERCRTRSIYGFGKRADGCLNFAQATGPARAKRFGFFLMRWWPWACWTGMTGAMPTPRRRTFFLIKPRPSYIGRIPGHDERPAVWILGLPDRGLENRPASKRSQRREKHF